jgi:hypothetical protein
MDERGNWIKRYNTTYNSNFPELGFTPTTVVNRETGSIMTVRRNSFIFSKKTTRPELIAEM